MFEEHWHLIFKSLERYRQRIVEVGTMGWHQTGTTVEAELARVDATVAFATALRDRKPYRLRNGESEPPTEHGWYWFRGQVDGQAYADSVTVMRRHYGGLCAIGQERVPPYLTLWVGEWWGPIEAPWQTAPEPQPEVADHGD